MLFCYNLYCSTVFEASSRRGDFMVKEYILDENYISVDEAAEYLGIKTVTLQITRIQK